MVVEFGIIAALAALVFWGFSDFLIQNSARKMGDWATVFVIDAFAVAALTPFVYVNIIPLLGSPSLILLVTAAASLLAASVVDFEALKKGKLAVVDPIISLEVPISAVLAFFVINEAITINALVLISVLVVSLALVSMGREHVSSRIWLERGALLAVVSAILMGASNFLIGFASRVADPLIAVWFAAIFSAVVSFGYIYTKGGLRKFASDIAADRKLIAVLCVMDNLAWVAFAVAASSIPVAVAVGVSESYVALAALLGLVINKEKLLLHQKFALIVALSSAIALAILYA